EGRADTALDQIPGRGDFAADEDAVGVDDVDDAAQSQSEVPRRGLKGGGSFPVAGSRASDQAVDSERMIAGRPLLRASEVPRQRREIRDVRFPAADGTARTARTIDVQRHVRKLSGDVVAPAQQLAVDDDADANAV